jgi:hypothetical protein
MILSYGKNNNESFSLDSDSNDASDIVCKFSYNF